MHTRRVEYVSEPAWRRVGRIAGYAAVGVALVLLLVFVLTSLKPVLP